MKIILTISLIISIIIIIFMHNEIIDLRYSRDLWQEHSIKRGEIILDNYHYDYRYLTTGG